MFFSDKRLTLFISLFHISFQADDYVINNKTFPDDFIFGVATSAVQIEGAWNEDGKTENIWDHIIRVQPDYIQDGSTPDVACDSYHKIKEDVALLKELGVDYYRFSLSWTRILPYGTADHVNRLAIKYYQTLLHLLLAHNIQPFVTLYHWDLPQVLQDQGGFLNESITDWFGDYARVAFKYFGKYVKLWSTFNEPKNVCRYGYGTGTQAPGIHSEGILDYACEHNLIKAHARAYHIYNDHFRYQQGKVSIVLNIDWIEAATDSIADQEAAERARQFILGWIAHPIFVGDYPEVMKSRIAFLSQAEGRNKSRLPQFTAEEIEYIRNTADFFSINTYTAALGVDNSNATTSTPTVLGDMGLLYYQPTEWTGGECDNLKSVSWAVRKLLNFIKDNYHNPDILISENGYCDLGGLEDDGRVAYIQSYLSHAKDAMENDGVKLFGYTVWSLMDNFEWNSGYRLKLGLYQVDFDDIQKTRTAKKSAGYYSKVIRTHCLVDSCD